MKPFAATTYFVQMLSTREVSPISFRRIVVIWLIAAAFALVQSVTQFARLGMQPHALGLVMLTFAGWMTWAALTPPIVYFTRRFPLERGRIAKALAIHISFGLLCVVLIDVVWEVLTRVLAEGAGTEAIASMESAYAFWRVMLNPVGNAMIGFVTYGCIVAAITAYDAVAQAHRAALTATRLERDVAQAREQAIKMQVHPHFLFNTLHAVSVLITEDPITARAMVMHLGDFLRATLERASRAEVTLQEELELLEHYLDVERLRFGDRLSVNIHAGGDVLDAYVPDLLLQPLAENAIKHGVSTRPGTHTIRIHAARCDSQLVLTVDDDGAANIAPDLQEGIGLGSTRRRLAHLYGDNWELTLTMRPTGGVRATIVLPYHLTPVTNGDAEEIDDDAA